MNTRADVTSMVHFENESHRSDVYDALKAHAQEPSRDPIRKQALLSLAVDFGGVEEQGDGTTSVMFSFPDEEQKEQCIASLEDADDENLNWLGEQL